MTGYHEDDDFESIAEVQAEERAAATEHGGQQQLEDHLDRIAEGSW